MSYVFISYKSEERDQAQRVRTALALAAKCEVWWDQNLQTGGAWHQQLDDAVSEAACVVVLFSEASSKSSWVLQEAAVAAAFKKLVPVLMDKAQLPQAYSSVQSANLAGWNGREDAAEFIKVVDGVRDCLRRDQKRRRGRWMMPVAAALVLGLGIVLGTQVSSALSAGTGPSGPNNECIRMLERLDTQTQDANLPSKARRALDAALTKCGAEP